MGMTTQIAEKMIVSVKEHVADPRDREAIYYDMIAALTDEDWDGEMDEVGVDAAYDAALRTFIKDHPDTYDDDALEMLDAEEG